MQFINQMGHKNQRTKYQCEMQQSEQLNLHSRFSKTTHYLRNQHQTTIELRFIFQWIHLVQQAKL